MKKKFTIEPVTRVEGHGKVTIQLDDEGNVEQARLHITQVRGFEKFVEGRLFWEMPVLTSRICGICPVSHNLAAAKAGDMILGVELTPTAEQLRRLLHLAQILQSHALHFFLLAGPDLLLGMESDPKKRNAMGLIAEMPDVARKGVRLRAFGQKIIEALGDKKIHPIAALPGGMAKAFSPVDQEFIAGKIDSVIADCQYAIALFKEYCSNNFAEITNFAKFSSSYVGLVNHEGHVEYYDGKLRIKNDEGNILGESQARDYLSLIEEKIEDWSYLKFPFISQLGYPEGMYRVGPLARLNVSGGCTTPLANAEYLLFRKSGPNGIVQESFYYHYARLIEMLNAAESIKKLVESDVICSADIRVDSGRIEQEGIGVIEAPRGTLIHHYWVDTGGRVIKANLIVATGHNNLPMNKAIEEVAKKYINNGIVNEGILNRVEVAIRCYDPCLSCSTHELGNMPLEIKVYGPDGTLFKLLKN